ncbi:MAG: hypothetical protein Q8O88_02560 [bacterium]|nr:hypothetical protein [bacterium]
MLITPHSITGAAIAVLLPYPLIALPLSVASHFILDKIPHWQETLHPYNPNRKTWIRIPIDLSIAVGAIWITTQYHPDIAPVIWLSAIAANMPDIDSIAVLIPSLFKNKLFKRFWDWHCKIQKETSSLWGLAPQAILFLILFHMATWNFTK